ncbi:MAG: Na+/H+ antiporter NhaA [Beijerinckiaceae bacterium]
MAASDHSPNPTVTGLMLAAAAALALIVANSPLGGWYQRLLDTPAVFSIGAFIIDKPLLLWINDGLMAIFFVLVGLEIKRELYVGELAGWDRAALPVIAAIGGFATPALIYTALNFGNPEAIKAWAVPTATDIAFVVGIVALLGKAVPLSLRAFVVALAIIDDLLAIIVIALFYTDKLSLSSLLIAGVCLAGLIALNRLRVRRLAPYILIGVIMWAAVLKSGVHATLAGVALALTIPLERDDGHSMLENFEHALAPYVGFLIVPIFAFANAGVPLKGLTLATFTNPVTLGIILGLVAGKFIGVTGATWLAVKSGITNKPEGAGWQQIIGVAFLTGIGFTMSLFIGALALPDEDKQVLIRIGVMTGSLIAGLIGTAILLAGRNRAA